MLDIVPVGHFSIDSILLPDRKAPFVVLGGSAAYVSLASRRLGAKVSVISKVGGDFPEAYLWWLSQEGVDLSGVVKDENAQTTRFELEYNKDLSGRLLRLNSRAPSITVEDIHDSVKAEAIHIGPIAGEITYDVVERLRDCADVLCLDPQGLVRNFGENGSVSLGPLTDRRILGLVDIFKSSSKEIAAVTGLPNLESCIEAVHSFGPRIVIVTLGADGAIVSVENEIHDVPAYKPEKLVDPTGAGDAFIGAFLTEYVRGEDCAWCSHVGSAAASLVVEAIGPTFFGDKDEIYRRARVLYEKEIKQ